MTKYFEHECNVWDVYETLHLAVKDETGDDMFVAIAIYYSQHFRYAFIYIFALEGVQFVQD